MTSSGRYANHSSRTWFQTYLVLSNIKPQRSEHRIYLTVCFLWCLLPDSTQAPQGHTCNDPWLQTAERASCKAHHQWVDERLPWCRNYCLLRTSLSPQAIRTSADHPVKSELRQRPKKRYSEKTVTRMPCPSHPSSLCVRKSEDRLGSPGPVNLLFQCNHIDKSLLSALHHCETVLNPDSQILWWSLFCVCMF